MNERTGRKVRRGCLSLSDDIKEAHLHTAHLHMLVLLHFINMHFFFIEHTAFMIPELRI